MAGLVAGSPHDQFATMNGMAEQITIQLPEALVGLVDEFVSAGRGRNRSEVITGALERERRHMIMTRDAQILAGADSDPELAGLIEYAKELSSELV